MVWLAGLNPGVLEVVRHAGLDRRLGRERKLFNAREAIERYQALQAAAGRAEPDAGARTAGRPGSLQRSPRFCNSRRHRE